MAIQSVTTFVGIYPVPGLAIDPNAGNVAAAVQKPPAGSPIRVSAKTLIKGSAGALLSLIITNTTGSTIWVQMFDAATTAAVTLGTTLPDLEFQVAANLSLNATIHLPSTGWPFGAGLVYAQTTAEKGATPGSAGDCLIFPTWI